MEGLSVLDMINQGALATYPLIAFSMVTVSIIFERLWSLRNLVSEILSLTDNICPTLEDGKIAVALEQTQSRIGTPAGRIFSDVLSRHSTDSLE